MADVNAGPSGVVQAAWITDGEMVRIEAMDGTFITGRIAMPISFRNNIVALYEGDTQFVRRFIPMANVQQIERLVEMP